MVSKERLHGDFISLVQEIKMNELNALLSPFLAIWTMDPGMQE